MAHDACTAALTTAELAAVPFGLGCCWAGFLRLASTCSPTVAQAVGLPDDCAMYGALMIGYPDETYYSIPPRNPLTAEWR